MEIRFAEFSSISYALFMYGLSSKIQAVPIYSYNTNIYFLFIINELYNLILIHVFSLSITQSVHIVKKSIDFKKK